MAGKNQHYIPQSLLRAFRIGPGKIARVYKHQAEGVFPLPTQQVAAEDWFYSRQSTNGDKTLDDLITDHEGGQLSTDFRALYSASAGPIEAPFAARTIGHLFGRGNHVRGTIRSGIALLADQIETLFGGEDQLRNIFGVDGPLPGERFREAFGRNLAENPTLTSLGLPRPLLETVAYMALRENLSAGVGDLNAHALSLVETFRENASTIARNAQVKSLGTTMLPEARIDVLESFAWRIEEMGHPCFVLPDFVALAFNSANETGTLLTFSNDEIATILMPLSPMRMLIGQREAAPLDLGRFNEEAIPHCFAFFVSAFTSDTLSVQRAAIGQRALEPIEKGLADATSEFRRQVEQLETPSMKEALGWDVALPSSFELEVQGYDQATRDAFGNALMRLVEWARNRFDVSDLIRFVIADDYEQALATIDRGVLNTNEPIKPSEEGMSVAYNVPVEVNGRIGVAIVLRGGIPAMLLGDNDEHYAAAASVVLGQLARLGADALLSKAFADGDEAGDACERAMMPRIKEVWRSYFIGRYQCLFGEGVRADYREKMINHLDGMTNRLIAARRTFRLDHDADALLATVLPDALGAVTLAGMVAAGIEDDPDRSAVESFRKTLDCLGLLKWFDLLKSDFSDIWREGEAYPSQEAFLVIVRHVQRMLIPGGIFFWESENGPRVEVPYATDTDWLLEQVAAGSMPAV